MSRKFKVWALIGASITAAVSGAGGSLTGFIFAPMLFCTAMIISELPQAGARQKEGE